jgi:hypothetical protein
MKANLIYPVRMRLKPITWSFGEIKKALDENLTPFKDVGATGFEPVTLCL